MLDVTGAMLTHDNVSPSSEYVFSRSTLPMTGGRVVGNNISGRVLPGGAVWHLLRTDGVTELEASYTITVGEGVLVKVMNRGLIVPPSNDGEQNYFRTAISFLAPDGPYNWLNKSFFYRKSMHIQRSRMQY